MVWLLWFALAIESASKLYLLQWIRASNHYLLHLYTVGEFWLLSMCYRELLQLSEAGRRRFLKAIVVLGGGITAYSLVCLVWPGWLPSESVQWYNKVLVNASVAAYAIWLFSRIIQSPGAFPGYSRGIVTLNSGVLLYYSATFVLFWPLSFCWAS